MRSRKLLATSSLVAAFLSLPAGLALADSTVYALHRSQNPCFDPTSRTECRAAKYHRALARGGIVDRAMKGGADPR